MRNSEIKWRVVALGVPFGSEVEVENVVRSEVPVIFDVDAGPELEYHPEVFRQLVVCSIKTGTDPQTSAGRDVLRTEPDL